MKFFVIAERPRSNPSRLTATLSYLLAAAVAGIVLLQLFSYEDMPAVVAGWAPMEGVRTQVTAAAVVVLQVASLPFLLRMTLSRLARMMSVLAGVLVVMFWLTLDVWATISGEPANIDPTIELPLGGWMLVPMALATIAFGYVLWQQRQDLRQ